jgi:hypothetical protein
MDDKLVALLKSRKFWAAVVGLASVFLGDRAGLTPEQITGAIVLLVSYILGTGIEDSKFRA